MAVLALWTRLEDVNEDSSILAWGRRLHGVDGQGHTQVKLVLSSGEAGGWTSQSHRREF